MAERMIKIDSIEFNEELYPRTKSNWLVEYNYSQAMKSGSEFPAILVARMNKRLILVDGKHRIEARKINKETHIKADVKTISSEKELYIMAVKANIKHGYQFSPFEKARIIKKLEGEMKLDIDEISSIINMPSSKLMDFANKRATISISGQEVILKAPLKHLSGQEVDDSILFEQDIFSVRSQMSLVNQLIALLENDQLIVKDVKKLEKLGKLLKETLNKISV